VRSRLLVVVKLSLDLLGQRLAELNTPLVEAVDIPDSALGESEVLVVNDQGTKRGGSDLVSQNGRSGSVAQESLMGHEVVRSTLGLDLVRGLADHQGLSLGEEVGSKHPTHVSYMIRWKIRSYILLVLVVLNRVMALCSQDEVGRDELGALVEQLVERVLSIGSRLTEQDGTGRVFDVVATAGDCLSVRLHGQLLEVSREPVHVLVEAESLLDAVRYLGFVLTERQDVSELQRSQSTTRLEVHQ